VEIVEKSKVGLSPDSHNAWKPAQNAGFHIPPATVAASTIKANAAEPLESRGFTDSRAEPKVCDSRAQLSWISVSDISVEVGRRAVLPSSAIRRHDKSRESI